MGDMKKIFKLTYYILIALLVFLALVVVSGNLSLKVPLRAYNVETGSMQPAIKAGSVVFVVPKDHYQADEIITFYTSSDNKNTATHRVVSVEEDADIGKLAYETKGDANDTADRGVTDHSRVVGKVVFTLPYLGYPVSFAKTQIGFVALIIVPAALIIYSEMISIKTEAGKIVKGKKEKRMRKSEEKPADKKAEAEENKEEN